MCGIAGRVNFDGAPVAPEPLAAMVAALAHRGPNAGGLFVRGRAGLGHRRLSIIDLAGGHQPLSNEDGSIWVVFNGEIYNFVELRTRLIARGHTFTTESDTEVLVHLYEEYGERCVEQLAGMFAFALWDEPRQRLLLARDRLGKKPLVYALGNRSLTFASEIFALLCDAGIDRDIDLDSVDLYLALGYVPAPRTALRSVRKLPPAHYLVCEGGGVRLERYWEVEFASRASLDEDEARDRIRTLLEDAVRVRLQADVPVGALLSGGVDSSVVVALAARQSGRALQTFSVGFDDDDYGELPFAREVARRYGTTHAELIVRPRMVDVLPELVRHYGEPYGDGSAVPTYFIAQLAAQSVRVVLSGDGGDEVFGGYPWYLEAPRHARLARMFLRDGLGAFQASFRDGRLRPMLGAVKGTAVGLDETLRGWLDPPRAYARLVTVFSAAARRALYTPEVQARLGSVDAADALLRDRFRRAGRVEFVDQLFDVDHHLYLPDDILVKVDIASMANSLEVRSPLLDHRLVELAASLPASFKVRAGTGKWIFKEAVADLLPESVRHRAKVGFGLPIDRWMRVDLHDMAHDVLLDPHARTRAFFDGRAVRDLLAAHAAGRQQHGQRLWQLLFLELWARACDDAARPLGAAGSLRAASVAAGTAAGPVGVTA